MRVADALNGSARETKIKTEKHTVAAALYLVRLIFHQHCGAIGPFPDPPHLAVPVHAFRRLNTTQHEE